MSAEVPGSSDGRPASKRRHRRRNRRGHPKSGQRQNSTTPSGGPSGASQAATSRPASQHFARKAPLYAALDLGTNNCRLLIAQPQGRGFRVVDAFSRIVRLGDGIGRTGAISKSAMDRAVEALKVCRDKIESKQVVRRRLIATEACRIADNGEEFLGRVRDEAGLDLEIVNAETEARLAVSGSASLIDRTADGVIIFDIGGGSTELIWLDMTKSRRRSPLSAHKRIIGWTSLPLGVVKLADMYGGVDVTPDSYEQMVQETLTAIENFEADGLAKEAIASGKNVHLLGTSGTVTTLAGVSLGLKRYDRRRVDGVWINRADMQGISNEILDWSYEERRQNGCIGPDRADLVLPGCAILEAICRAWPCEKLRVADRGLREGILTMLMAEDGVWRRQPPKDGSTRPRSRRRKPRKPKDTPVQ